MCFQSIVAVVRFRHHDRQHFSLDPCQRRGALYARKIEPHRSPQRRWRQAHHFNDVPYLSRAHSGGFVAPPQITLSFIFGYRFDPSHAHIVAAEHCRSRALSQPSIVAAKHCRSEKLSQPNGVSARDSALSRLRTRSKVMAWWTRRNCPVRRVKPIHAGGAPGHAEQRLGSGDNTCPPERHGNTRRICYLPSIGWNYCP